MKIRMMPDARLRGWIRKAQVMAHDGMRLAVLGLAAMVVFAHPAGEAKLAICLGLAGIFCARLTRRPAPARPAARPAQQSSRPSARHAVSRQRLMWTYSPECLASEHGECSGVGCTCPCGHPARARRNSRTRTVPDDKPPF